MDESNYHELADSVLEHIFQTVEEADEEGVIDSDFHDGVINIVLPDGQEFVINKHSPTQQIWMSSPNSGARHFVYNEEENLWIDTRSEDDLMTLLQEDFDELTSINAAF